MERKAISGIMLTMLFSGLFTLAFNIPQVKAEGGTIYIRADGSIVPSTAPIQRDGDVYTLTDDITTIYNDGIVIQRDNMTLDGAGHILSYGTMTYPLAYPFKGIDLSERSNITIKNMEIKAFWHGIWLKHSTNNTISGSNITDNWYAGIELWYSSYNTMVGNNITGTEGDGILLDYSSNNNIATNNIYEIGGGILLANSPDNHILGNNITSAGEGIGIHSYSSHINIVENNLTNNWVGIVLDRSPNNFVSGNNIENNEYGIFLWESSSNSIYHNDFIENTNQVATGYMDGCSNIWDGGYPSGGNYWSDYTGFDEQSGPNQDELGSDGIGDTPYIIDEDNIDQYPLMVPWNVVLPIEDLAEETTSDEIQSADAGGGGDGSPDFAWTSGYDISFVSQTLHMEINIQLVGDDPGEALRTQWEEGIEGIWSNVYDIVDGIHTYPIEVEVNWVNANPHHVVTVHSEHGRPNMLNWYTQTDWGPDYQDEIVAHEAGHMLGLYDEYAEPFTDTNNNGRYDLGEPFTDSYQPPNGIWDCGALDPNTWLITTNSLMADLGPARIWHYEQILDWLETRSGRDLSLAQSPLPPYIPDDPIPDFSDPILDVVVNKIFKPQEICSKRNGAVMSKTNITNSGDSYITELTFEDEILSDWIIKNFDHTISVTLFIDSVKYEIPYDELTYASVEDNMYVVHIDFIDGVDLYQYDPILGQEVYVTTIYAFEPGWILQIKYPMISPKSLSAGDYDAKVSVTLMSTEGITATVGDTSTLIVN